MPTAEINQTVPTPYNTSNAHILSPTAIQRRIQFGQDLMKLDIQGRKRARIAAGINADTALECIQVAGIFGSKSEYDISLVSRAGWRTLVLLSRDTVDEGIRKPLILLVLHWLEHWWKEKFLHPDSIPHIVCPNTIAASPMLITDVLRDKANYDGIHKRYIALQKEKNIISEQEPLTKDEPQTTDHTTDMQKQIALYLHGPEMSSFLAALIQDTSNTVFDTFTAYLTKTSQSQEERLLAKFENMIVQSVDAQVRDILTRRMAALESVIELALATRGDQAVQLMRSTYNDDMQALHAAQDLNKQLQEQLQQMQTRLDIEREENTRFRKKIEDWKQFAVILSDLSDEEKP